MRPINVYTSNAAGSNLAGVVAALGMNLGRPVQLLPIEQLPAPDLLRRQALRLEQRELREDIQRHRATLAAYRNGERQPNAGRENGLLFDIEALGNRLRAVNGLLGEGGQDNG